MPEAARTRFRVPADLSVPRLLAAAGFDVETSSTGQRTLEIVDTADGRLAAAWAELSFSPRTGWSWLREPQGHTKLRAREWTAPATTDLAVLHAWSRAYHRGAELAPRARMVVQHRIHRVSSGDGEILTLLDERADEAGGRTTTRSRRVRVTHLADDGAAPAVIELIRERELPTAATRELTDAHATDARSLFRRSTQLSLMQWRYFDCELSAGHADALRKLRVATRRLRSDLQTFRPLLDADWAAGLRARIDILAHDLGVVRDAEVLAARLGELAALAPTVDPVAAQALQDTARSRLDSARRALLVSLDGGEYLELIDAVVEAVAQPHWADVDVIPPVTRFARRAWRRLHEFVSEGKGEPDDERLHRIRILAKRTRYAVEACVPAAGEPAAGCARAIADLQTVLGDHHDAVVTRSWLRSQADAAAGVAYTAGELAALELGRLNDAAARWPGAWSAASRRRDWRWLRG